MTAIDPDFARRVSAALATGPEALMAELSAFCTALPGITAATYLAVAPDNSVLHRIGTSDPENLPVGGFDPVDDGAWCRRILGEKRAIIGDTPDAMRPFIPETDDLVAMGYGATMCVPLVIAGEVKGTINLLGDTGALTDEVLAHVDSILPIAALIFTFRGISDR